MAEENPPKNPEAQNQGNTNADVVATPTEQIGTPLRNLSSAVASLTDEIKANNKKEEGRRQEYQAKQLYWLKIATRSNIVTSALALVVSFLTLLVLNKTLTVVDKQRQITGDQLTVMQGQLQQMRSSSTQTDRLIEAAFKQSEATRDSADAAKTAIEVTQANIRLEQRAWVGIDSMRIADLEPGKPILATAVIVNSGRTFALSLTVRTRVTVTKTSPDLRIDRNAPVEGILSNFALPPNGKSSATASTPPISENIVTLIKNGESRIYFFGTVSYVDIFNRRHETEFCGFNKLGTNDVDFCDRHNRAD